MTTNLQPKIQRSWQVYVLTTQYKSGAGTYCSAFNSCAISTSSCDRLDKSWAANLLASAVLVSAAEYASHVSDVRFNISALIESILSCCSMHSLWDFPRDRIDRDNVEMSATHGKIWKNIPGRAAHDERYSCKTEQDTNIPCNTRRDMKWKFFVVSYT